MSTASIHRTTRLAHLRAIETGSTPDSSPPRTARQTTGDRNAAVPSVPSEHEEHRPHDTKRRPEVVHLERLVHVEIRERHEHAQRYHFLHDLELAESECSVSDSIRRHLQHVLEQRDPPADESRYVPRLGFEILQVGVPGERHEYVGAHQQSGSPEDHRPENREHCHGSRQARKVSQLQPTDSSVYFRRTLYYSEAQ